MAREGDSVRPAGSHIRDDGSPKRVFESEEDAAGTANAIWLRTGRTTGYYLCAQRPNHWHVGNGLPDINRSNL